MITNRLIANMDVATSAKKQLYEIQLSRVPELLRALGWQLDTGSEALLTQSDLTRPEGIMAIRSIMALVGDRCRTDSHNGKKIRAVATEIVNLTGGALALIDSE